MNSANKRKFRTWQNSALFQALEQCIQIEETCLSQLNENNGSIEKLPPSVIPTHILFNLALAYQEAYAKLLQQDLVSCGYNKQSTTTH